MPSAPRGAPQRGILARLVVGCACIGREGRRGGPWTLGPPTAQLQEGSFELLASLPCAVCSGSGELHGPAAARPQSPPGPCSGTALSPPSWLPTHPEDLSLLPRARGAGVSVALGCGWHGACGAVGTQ